MVVVALGKNLLFKSVLAHCDCIVVSFSSFFLQIETMHFDGIIHGLYLLHGNIKSETEADSIYYLRGRFSDSLNWLELA